MLPEFLRLPPSPPGQEEGPRPREHPASPPSCTSTPPATPHVQEAEAAGVQTVEGEHVADLMLTGEGDISSPNSTLLPPAPAPQGPAGPPAAGTAGRGSPALL